MIVSGGIGRNEGDQRPKRMAGHHSQRPFLIRNARYGRYGRLQIYKKSRSLTGIPRPSQLRNCVCALLIPATQENITPYHHIRPFMLSLDPQDGESRPLYRPIVLSRGWGSMDHSVRNTGLTHPGRFIIKRHTVSITSAPGQPFM